MQYAIILVRGDDGQFGVSVPSMPGCFSLGDTREQALARVRDAMRAWLDAEVAAGRGPLPETPAVIAAGVTEALEIIDEMRASGEMPPERGYELEVASVEVQPAVAA